MSDTEYIIKDCISCRGSGTIYVWSYYADNSEDTVNYRCHTYNGVWEVHKCKECQGAGKVRYTILCKQL